MLADFALALDLSVRVAAVGLALGAAEMIADRAAFGVRGPFGAGVLTAMRGAPDWVLTGPGRVSRVAWLQLVAAVTLLAIGPQTGAGRAALLVVVLTSTFLRWRRGLGGDGAEQLTTVIVLAAALAFVPGDSPERAALAAAFVAGQAVLAYTTAGIAKLVSPVWRDGSALPDILTTRRHGHALAARLLRARPGAGTALGRAVIGFEVLFPLLLLAPLPVAVGTLLAGLGFHLGCALLMGLNSFLWAFPATYTCLLAVRSFLLD